MEIRRRKIYSKNIREEVRESIKQELKSKNIIWHVERMIRIKVNGMFVSRVRGEPGECPYQGKKEELEQDWLYLNWMEESWN